MKKVFIMLVALFGMSIGVFAQDDIYSTGKPLPAYVKKPKVKKEKRVAAFSGMSRASIDSLARVNNVAAAGRLLRLSSSMEFASVGTTAVGAGVIVGGAASDTKGLYYLGGGLGVVGLVLHLVSTGYEGRAGRMLEVTPTGVKVTF